MDPVEFPEQNDVMRAPPTMENCVDLNIYRHIGTSPYLISCWKLSPQELAEIQKTGVVWLYVFGRGMPPVALQAKSPFA